jgi:hypothetical protein
VKKKLLQSFPTMLISVCKCTLGVVEQRRSGGRKRRSMRRCCSALACRWLASFPRSGGLLVCYRPPNRPHPHAFLPACNTLPATSQPHFFEPPSPQRRRRLRRNTLNRVLSFFFYHFPRQHAIHNPQLWRSSFPSSQLITGTLSIQ